MKPKSHKISDTSVRVLEILKLLMVKPRTKEELIELINASSKIEAVHRNETLGKYFLTFKLLGLDIAKVSNHYVLQNFPVEVDFSQGELELLQFLENYVCVICKKGCESDFANILEKLEKSFSQETKKKYVEVKNKIGTKCEKYLGIKTDRALIVQFEKYCSDNQKLKIVYNNKTLNCLQEFNVEPIGLIYKAPEAVLLAYNSKLCEKQKFILKNIVSHSQQPLISHSMGISSGVTFSLCGRLAKTYEFKENETLLRYEGEKIVVVNRDEDKSVLLTRLLKYGKYCEILYPKTQKENIIELISSIKGNYD